MEKPINLEKLSKKDFKKFIDSFDTVLTDCDGVLWLNNSSIIGSFDVLKKLEELGKKILFVSNNSVPTIDDYLIKIKNMGFNASSEQLIIPSKIILWHLKCIDFKGKVMIIGSPALKKAFADEGIDVVSEPNILEGKIDAIGEVMKIIPDVKAVIFDFDFNFNWAKLTQADLYLKHDDVLFFCGPLDKKLPVAPGVSLIGPGSFVEILINKSGRIPIEYAKPSKLLVDYLSNYYILNNPKRCIFIGDSLSNDMKFAQLAGFQKLWVGSGVDPPGSEEFLEFNDKPDFYLPKLGDLGNLIKQIDEKK